jgi:hypothetical protein
MIFPQLPFAKSLEPRRLRERRIYEVQRLIFHSCRREKNPSPLSLQSWRAYFFHLSQRRYRRVLLQTGTLLLLSLLFLLTLLRVGIWQPSPSHFGILGAVVLAGIMFALEEKNRSERAMAEAMTPYPNRCYSLSRAEGIGVIWLRVESEDASGNNLVFAFTPDDYLEMLREFSLLEITHFPPLGHARLRSKWAGGQKRRFN